MNYIIGIDSGATSSEAVIMSCFPLPGKKVTVFSGPNITRKKYPPVNYNLIGLEETVKRLRYIIKNISAKIPAGKVTSIAAGISGARYENDRKLIAKRLTRETGVKKIKILPDTEIAFSSIFEPDQVNCGILIAGTGSILYYKSSNGKLNRAGGWGRVIGDEGSGYWIAKKAFCYITKSFDRNGKKTLLTEMFAKNYKLNEATIIKKIYHDGFDIAQAAKLVFRAAEKGDAVGRSIIKEAAAELAEHFLSLKKGKYNIALMGSLFTEEKLLEAGLKKISAAAFPNIVFIKPTKHPVWGAIKIASREAR